MFAPTKRLLSVTPISVAEFRESLASIWLPRVRVRSPRLGLAVSGGVDSMALATLCADLSEEIGDDDDTDVFTAFIVDHRLRKGSADEALTVQDNLYKLGIPSEILQMQWPQGVETTSLTNLESLARRFRFRLLGQACRNHGIESLLLAHHSDDQAETILMRLIEGHRGMGLRGIKAACDIPECWGMHGVHQSHAEELDSDGSLPPLKPQHAVDVEYWGVQILRPLLPFTKARLTATCEASGTQWVEDETNKDPTLTLRNAIRHVYDKYKLPAALGKPALLQLAQHMTDKSQRRADNVDALLKRLDAVLDIRSGELAIRFERNLWPPSNYLLNFVHHKEFDMEDGKIVAAMLIRHLANLVSPRETIDISSFDTAVRHLFPRLYLHNLSEDLPEHIPASFTAAGVLFERVQTPNVYFPYYTWMISRQPYVRDEHPTLIIPPGSSQQAPPPFSFFDGRFWLRIHNPSPDRTLHVRPLRHTDVKPFRAALTDADQERFETLRMDSAQRKARYTLPVIATMPDAEGGGDEVVALPTFGIKVREREWAGLAWEVRYKKLDAAVMVRDGWGEHPGAEEGDEDEALGAEEEEEEDVPFVMDGGEEVEKFGR